MLKLLLNIVMLPIIFTGALVLGISEVIYSGDKNVSKDKKFEYLISKSFELKEDSFYVQWSDTKEYSIAKRGCSMFPASVSDYERDPDNWMHTDAYAQKGCGVNDGYMKQKIIGVVRAGTRLTIVKTILVKSLVKGNRYKIYARIDNGRFAGHIVLVNFMFDVSSLLERATPKIDMRLVSVC